MQTMKAMSITMSSLPSRVLLHALVLDDGVFARVTRPKRRRM
jgi:hypothetical protein